MWGIEGRTSWNSLANPFTDNQARVISGRVSCRSIEIRDIIASEQNALILAGRPKIGKSTLIRYLQLPPTWWSWRDELEAESDNRKVLDDIHFAQIDLKPLLVDYKDSEDKLLDTFVKECTRVLYQAYKPGESYSDLTLKGLYKLLNAISEDADEDTRYFLILDNIERLGELYMQLANVTNAVRRPQEYGIKLLDRCRAIRTINDLIDGFKLFGFILSIESLPKATVVDQYTNMSADLARFKTKTLQIFTMRDTRKFLAQRVKDFKDGTYTSKNDSFDDSPLFLPEEQSWLLELCGSHPYLLQQCCYYLFQFKAYSKDTALQNNDKEQFLSIIYEQVGTFLSRTWKRLQEAINSSTNIERVNDQFQAFISLCASKKPEDTIDTFWESLDMELRYILYSEGIIRSDLRQSVHCPGTILRDYLVKQIRETNKTSGVELTSASVAEHTHSLRIMRPGMETKQISLSKLEYRLLKTLLAQAGHCTEQELIQSAWERGTERANLTQRLYKLRKKIEDQLNGIDIIENRYGGIYSLTHPEWLELD